MRTLEVFMPYSMRAPLAYLAVFAMLVLMALPTGPGRAASLDMLGVQVENNSEPVLCAEKDNVTLTFASPKVKSFRIEATHPNYIGTLEHESWEPDWTACDFAGEALSRPSSSLRKVMRYKDLEPWLIGYTFAKFWRTNRVPLRVGDKTDDSLHLIEVWGSYLRHSRLTYIYETLVLYPPDGYWRARPLPPKHVGYSNFGSSFLIGPIEEDNGRPFVNLKEIAFDPKTKTFTLAFVRGGSAKVTITKLDSNRMHLDVTFDQPIDGAPFAALRSMYVTRFNNDVANVAVLEKGARSWREQPVMEFSGARAATDIWAGRLVPSSHNTSAPDMVFSAFSDGISKQSSIPQR
jgi:hypothetical protein